MEIVAIDKVAEKILQTTTADMARLHGLGHKLELNSIKTEFQSKKYLLFLSKTASKSPENRRRLLLEAYYEDSAPLPPVGTDYATLAEGSSGSSKETELPISPLKPQLSEIMITQECSVKKQLTWMNEPRNKPEEQESTADD